MRPVSDGRLGHSQRLLGFTTWGALSLLSISFIPMVMLFARMFYSQSFKFAPLLWNLFLAWLPLLLALLAFWLRRRPLLSLFFGGLWLLFLPNAPYLVTDLIYLRQTFQVPVWFDAIMLFAFALAGMALGLYSLHIMHELVSRQFGPLIGWIFVIVAVGLSSFGVYVGRFLRWNSWDLFLQPSRLAADIFHNLTTPESLAKMVIVVSLFALLTFTGHVLIFPRRLQSQRN